MTHSPVVLVHIYACKHVHSPLPQDIWAHEVFAIPAKTPATSQPSISTSNPPLEAQLQSLPRANLCQHVHLDPMPPYGPVCHPITKVPYLDHKTGVESQIFHPPWG